MRSKRRIEEEEDEEEEEKTATAEPGTAEPETI